MFDNDHKKQAEEILAYCIRSMEYGLNFNTQGNISIRLPGVANRFMITPTDLEYDRMSPDDMVIVDTDANVLAGKHEPSSEVTVHLATYRRRPDANAIVHTEPVYANVFGVLGEPITGALVGRQPFGGFRMSGIGGKAGGPDYLLQFVVGRTITENTIRRGFAPPAEAE